MSRLTYAFKRAVPRGFTLIELLIAVVVGIILLGGLIQIFVLTKNNYRIQQGLNYMQENLRFAVSEVGYSMRMAGYFYNVARPTSALAADAASVFSTVDGTGKIRSKNELTLLPGMTVSPGCGMLSWTVSVQGFDASATPPACVQTANYVIGTDLLFVSYLRPIFLGLPAITTPAVRTATGTASLTQPATNVVGVDILPDDVYAIIFDPGFKPDVNATQGGLIGTGSLLTSAYRDPSLFYDASQTSEIARNGITAPENTIKRSAAMMPLQAELYYVRPCSVLEPGSNVCTTTSDGGNPQPTLMRLNVASSGGAGAGARAFIQEPIVSGIEQFQIEYLASGCANYLSATDLVAWLGCDGAFTEEQRWQRVINVRVAMVARSNERGSEVDTEIYALSADTAGYTAASNNTQLPSNERYRRRTMISYMQPRNAVRPLPPL